MGGSTGRRRLDSGVVDNPITEAIMSATR